MTNIATPRRCSFAFALVIQLGNSTFWNFTFFHLHMFLLGCRLFFSHLAQRKCVPHIGQELQKIANFEEELATSSRGNVSQISSQYDPKLSTKRLRKVSWEFGTPPFSSFPSFHTKPPLFLGAQAKAWFTKGTVLGPRHLFLLFGSENSCQETFETFGGSGPTAWAPLSRYRASLYLPHLCFSGMIAGYRAIPPQICPIPAEGSERQRVLQLKLPFGGYRDTRGYC